MKKVVVPRIDERLTNPLIGSGKIRRRCFIKKYEKEKSRSEKLHENLFRRSKTIPYRTTKTMAKKPIVFSTANAKIIFNYWNNLGYPFVRHQPIKSKVTSKGIERINKAIKSHGKEAVLNAIATAEKVFNSGWFKWRLAIGTQKLSLPDFFIYSNEGHKSHSKRIKNLPWSWFEECAKGLKYMERNYSVVKTDKLPHITQRLIDTWEEYTKLKPLRSEREQLKRVSIHLNTFCNNNELDWLTIVDIIEGMLNKWHTYKPKHAGYMLNNIFWGEVLKREIIRYGLVDKDFKWARDE